MNIEKFKSCVQSFVLAKGGRELADMIREKDIPNSPGVYLFEQAGKTIYIGKAGTFGENKEWAKQGIRDRLKNKQSAKHPRERMSRAEFFSKIISDQKAPVRVYWMETCKRKTTPTTTKNFPALIEAELLADFIINNEGRLPRENNSF